MKKGLIIFMAVGLLSSLAVGNALGQVLVAPPVVTTPMAPPPVVNLPTRRQVMALPPVVSAPPRWQPIPSVAGMEYAPGIHQDLFRYGGSYYQFNNGQWYQGPNYNGPWGMIHRPPQAFYQVEHHYWKTPPGWAKHKHRGWKRGWGDAHMPPGQAKKYRETYVHPQPYPFAR